MTRTEGVLINIKGLLHSFKPTTPSFSSIISPTNRSKIEQQQHYPSAGLNKGYIMEQGRLSVLGKRSRDRFVDETWDEEKAFAKDAAAVGLLGGCVWPPRSYFCSFCNREFRSAQALGGHMNIHRRDRAKLKQVSTSINNNHVLLHPTEINSYSMPLSSIKNHGEIDDFFFDFTNPNTDPTVFLSSVTTSVHQKMSKPTSKQLGLSTELCRENSPSFSFALKQKSCLSLSRVCKLTKHSTVVEKEDPVEENESDDRILEVNGIESCLINDLDLELRLGDRPKVGKCTVKCDCDELTILTKSLN